jgi:hypothetical protein
METPLLSSAKSFGPSVAAYLAARAESAYASVFSQSTVSAGMLNISRSGVDPGSPTGSVTITRSATRAYSP